MTPWLTRAAPLAALALALPAPLLAQNGPPPRAAAANGYGGSTSCMPVQQVMERMRRKLGRADANRDNRITLAEWNARGKHGGGKGKDRSRQFGKIDTNRDGFVTTAELDAFMQKHVAKMDRNGDGCVSPDEHGHGGKGGKHRQAGAGAGDDTQY